MPDKVEFETQAYMQKQRHRALAVMDWFDRWMENTDMSGLILTKVMVKAVPDDGGDVLVVITARDEQGQSHVAFSSGPTMFEALETAKTRHESVGLKWRDDQPWPRTDEKRQGGRSAAKKDGKAGE